MAENLSFVAPSKSSFPHISLSNNPSEVAALRAPGVASPALGDKDNLSRKKGFCFIGGGGAMAEVVSGESKQTSSSEAQALAGSDEDEEEKGSGKGSSGKSRRELPTGAVATLKAWLLSPEHFTHPYPTPQDQIILMQKTGIDKKQLKNWFTNARRRIWKPMLKKQLEQGKITATGTPGGGVVTIPGPVPGLLSSATSPPLTVASAAAPPATTDFPANPVANGSTLQYQAVQQPQQGYDAFGNPPVAQQQPHAQIQHQQPSLSGSTVPATQGHFTSPFFMAQQTLAQQQQQQPQQQQTTNNASTTDGAPAPATLAPASAITSMPSVGGSSAAGIATVTSAPSPLLNKTDSHAVLMELFARDQDLVRQATESAKKRTALQSGPSAPSPSFSVSDPTVTTNHSIPHIANQHPMKNAVLNSQAGGVPSLNSWPHFSSVSSLNNLGTMTGVKSITNMSGADLASQGCLNKMGNLAHVKSLESMGGNDSYAFLEVFFDGANGQRGLKREREEDNDVGLSLDGDDPPPPSGTSTSKPGNAPGNLTATTGPTSPVPLSADGKDKEGTNDSGTLKRAYDDALAARGLLSVSRSSEKLTDLVLPPKMQRTLSQEIIRQQQMQSSSSPTPQFTSFNFANPAQSSSNTLTSINDKKPATFNLSGQTVQHYPGQHPSQQTASPTISTAPPNTGQKKSQTSDVEPESSGLSSPHQQQQSTLKGDHPVGPNSPTSPTAAPLSDPSMMCSSVEVPATTKCALCNCINVDTQLRPCGHMFHGACLKPSLQNACGAPKCPIDHIPMQSAVLAAPVDQNVSSNSTQQQPPKNGGRSFLPSLSGLSTETSKGRNI